MRNYNRIFWERGLDITPEIFIGVDNYNTFQWNIIRKLNALRSYGILPGRKFQIETNIDSDILSVRKLNCLAITQQGNLIDISTPISFREIKLYECTNEDHYLVLRVRPYEIEPLEDNKPYARPKYDIEIKNTRTDIEDGIPILKICRIDKKWEKDPNYILPSVSFCADENLLKAYETITKKLSEITAKFSDEDFYTLQIKLLEIELKNYSSSKSPFELITLLKKIIAVSESYVKKLLKSTGDLDCLNEFVERKYNHNETAASLTTAYSCLDTIIRKLEEKPEPEVKPEPVLLPPPAIEEEVPII
jgi:hypothetical protein